MTVYDDNYLKDKAIGKVQIGLRDLLMRPATPWKQWWSLGEGKGKILMTLQFLSVYEGMLRMNLMEGVGLVKPDLVGDADVYVTMKLNDKVAKKKQKVQSKVIDGGGINPVWKGGEMLLMWVTEDACFEGCQVSNNSIAGAYFYLSGRV